MADYSKRIDEILKDFESIREKLPAEAVQRFTDAIGKYKAWRREALEDLLKVLEEDDDDESARSWSDLCSVMRVDAAKMVDEALNNTPLNPEATVIAFRWLPPVAVNEGKFFEMLAKTNAAAVRDYLVTNRESLRNYTQTLDQKWRAIVEAGNRLQSDEKRVYDEMLEMTKRVVEEISRVDTTLNEDMRKVADHTLFIVEKAGGVIADLLNLPDGVAELAEKAAEKLREKNQAAMENHRALQGRAANYRSLVQAEKGGVLPLFKETRREVYEYWDRNNPERARDWLKKFQSSVEGEWAGALPTSAQRDDARDFYQAALERVEKHQKAVESIAKEFEEKWNGVFKGALSPKAADELLDTAAWRMNAETLVAIHTPSIVDSLLKKMDGYYEESFTAPVAKLKSMAEGLDDERKEELLRAVDLMRKRVEESVKVRIGEFQRQVGESLRWFESDELKKTLDRSELESGLS